VQFILVFCIRCVRRIPPDLVFQTASGSYPHHFHTVLRDAVHPEKLAVPPYEKVSVVVKVQSEFTFSAARWQFSFAVPASSSERVFGLERIRQLRTGQKFNHRQ
jgi:hypothetical protein